MENSKIVIVVALIVVVALAIGIYTIEPESITSRVISPISKTVTITLENVDAAQPLSPGVYIVHDGSVSLDFEGEMSPDELEPLAEYGSNSAFVGYVNSMRGVVEVIRIDAPIMPGQSTSFNIDLTGLRGPLYLSGVQMAVGSNDGYTLLDRADILDSNGRVLEFRALAENFDAGTEGNLPLLTGFFGGQPDPAFGELNVENGQRTLEVVQRHMQLTEPILRVSAGRR
jgi:hypothetical protein